MALRVRALPCAHHVNHAKVRAWRRKQLALKRQQAVWDCCIALLESQTIRARRFHRSDQVPFGPGSLTAADPFFWFGLFVGSLLVLHLLRKDSAKGELPQDMCGKVLPWRLLPLHLPCQSGAAQPVARSNRLDLSLPSARFGALPLRLLHLRR